MRVEAYTLDRISVTCEDDLFLTSTLTQIAARKIPLSKTDETKLIIAVMEIVRNILDHAKCGEVKINVLTSEGVEVIAIDEGPGIADLDKAFEEGYTTGSGLGLGLAGVKRLVDEFTIRSEVNAGTYVRIVKWKERRRKFDVKQYR